MPELASEQVRLRELRLTDARSLSETLASPKVGEHLSPGPASVAETEEFIAWTRRARMAGRYICFGVIPPRSDAAVGVFQIWPLEPGFRTAEWGSPSGTGSGAAVCSRPAPAWFQRSRSRRSLYSALEARAAVDNVRGNAALKGIGAVPEGVLRKCFLANGEYRDHVMWSILAAEWRAANDERAGQVTGEVA